VSVLPRLGTDGRPTVLAVTSEAPWPLDSGGHLRTFHLLSALARRFDVRLVTSHGTSAKSVAALRRVGIYVLPAAVASRGWPRELSRAVACAARRTPFVLYGRHHHASTARLIEAEIARQPPDLLYLDHLDSLGFYTHRASIPVVADLHNVYSTLVRRTADESRPWPMRVYLRREARLLEAAERLAARRADTLFASSNDDCDSFRRLGARHVRLVPNGIDCAAHETLPVGRFGTAPLILYVGTMSWEPNARAAVFLANDVLPRIKRQFPNARLRIVGRDPTRDVRALSAQPDVEVTGRVPDMAPHLAAAHLLAVPLEAGGGTRLKILEAFAAGLPVVSTAVGAEGIDAIHERDIVIADRAAFADAIGNLLRQPTVAQGLAERARLLARERYDWSAIGETASTAVAELVERSVRAS